MKIRDWEVIGKGALNRCKEAAIPRLCFEDLLALAERVRRNQACIRRCLGKYYTAMLLSYLDCSVIRPASSVSHGLIGRLGQYLSSEGLPIFVNNGPGHGVLVYSGIGVSER